MRAGDLFLMGVLPGDSEGAAHVLRTASPERQPRLAREVTFLPPLQQFAYQADAFSRTNVLSKKLSKRHSPARSGGGYTA
jgi:hypothetical protein